MCKKILVVAAIGLIGLLLFVGVFTVPSEQSSFNSWFSTTEVKSADATTKADQLGAGESTTNSGNKLVIRVNVRKSATKN